MDQPKIERLLKLMVMMTGNTNSTIEDFAHSLKTTSRSVYRYIDTIRSSGFVVEKMRSNVYKLGKMPRGSVDFSKLIYFSEEEAHIINSLIHNLDNTNLLKRNLQKKLAALCEYVTPAEIICDKTASIKVEALGNAIFHKKSVILRNYESANSDHTSDRLIEPFAFSANYIDIWGYDLEKGENRVYKVSRIGNVEITSDSWINEDNHRKVEADCFRMNGETDIRVKLHLSLRAKNLLVEEYPLAEKDLKHQKEHWTLETIVHDMAGVGRFVIGLADEIDISDSPELEQYIHDYALRHIINRKRDPEAPL